MNKKSSQAIRMLSLGAGLALAPGMAKAVDVDWTFKGTIAGVADSGRDLGLAGVGDEQRGYIDLTPWVHLQFSQSWSALLRVRAFAPTDSVLIAGNDNNNVAASSKAFVGLKEAWIDYRGLTSYPGESLRIGRQRIRQDDAQWWDQDIDAARWLFDTTLLQFQLGAARQFDTYRTDSAPLPASQRNRTYEFATVSFEPAPEVRLGLRAVHADDDASHSPAGTIAAADGRRSGGHLTWLGIYSENHAYDGERSPDFSYWASADGLIGSRYQLRTDSSGAITGESSDSVGAWASELGGRLRLPAPLPVQLGAAYVYSSGAENNSFSRQYEQTGLQSNYSRFTGTRTLINRFNDAYRAELGNLKVASAFASLTLDHYDASVIFSHFERVNGGAPVTVDGIGVNPPTRNTTLGQGYDFVLTRYFGIDKPISKLEPADDSKTSIRLRGSLFEPGSAYGPAARRDYRVSLELSLWY